MSNDLSMFHCKLLTEEAYDLRCLTGDPDFTFALGHSTSACWEGFAGMEDLLPEI